MYTKAPYAFGLASANTFKMGGVGGSTVRSLGMYYLGKGCCKATKMSATMKAHLIWYGLFNSVSQDTLSCQSSWSSSFAAIVTGVTRPSGSKINDAYRRICCFVIRVVWGPQAYSKEIFGHISHSSISQAP